MTTLRLAHLPPELLDYILQCGRASYLVVELWKCGDKELNMKLHNGGCTAVLLRDQKLVSSSRWPSMLQYLRRLKSLRIIRNGSIGNQARLISGLQNLSSTLEELDLSIKFLDVIFPLPKQLPGSDDESIVASTHLNFAKLFPSLKALVLNPEKEVYIPIATLPPHLETLTIYPWSGCVTSKMFTDKLPRTLVSLELRLQREWTLLDLLGLPRTLTSLNTQYKGIIPELPLTNALIESLPPSLTTLPIQKFEQALEFSSTVNYPSALTSIDARINLSKVGLSLQQLPRTLTALTVNFLGRELTPGDMKELPALKTLSLVALVSWPSTIGPSDWPSSLEVLDIGKLTKFFAQKHLKQLPVGGTIKKLKFWWDATFANFGELPQSLTHLHMVPIDSYESSIRIPNANCMPPLLQTLILDSPGTMLKSSPSLLLAALPASVTHLKLYFSERVGSSFHTMEETDYNFPSRLKTLSIDARFLQNKAFAYSRLPQSLVSLHLNNYFSPTRAILESLPSLIRVLRIEYGVFPSELIPCLPRSLIKLVMPTSKVLGLYFKQLPFYLQTLEISFGQTTTSLAELPRSIRHLVLHNHWGSTVVDIAALLDSAPPLLETMELTQNMNEVEQYYHKRGFPAD